MCLVLGSNWVGTGSTQLDPCLVRGFIWVEFNLEGNIPTRCGSESFLQNQRTTPTHLPPAPSRALREPSVTTQSLSSPSPSPSPSHADAHWISRVATPLSGGRRRRPSSVAAKLRAPCWCSPLPPLPGIAPLRHSNPLCSCNQTKN